MTNMLLENSGQVTPERMKRWSQSKNKAKQNKTKQNEKTVMVVIEDVSKVRCCKEQYC